MHGMLSLGILVAAFAAVTGGGIFVSVRLYLKAPAGRSRPAARPTGPAGTAVAAKGVRR